MNEEILSSLEQEGRIAAKEISRWRVKPGATMPTPSEEEVVILKSHIDRGLSLPPSYFLKGVLRHYRLQLHHIAPNSFTTLAGFVAVGDIPNRYTSDVVLNQQARVAHHGWYGGFAIPGGPVAEVDTAVLDAGAYGGSLDMSMADPETGPWRTTDDKPMADRRWPMAGYLVVHA
jgi:hypothetical protein